ncbi:MAG TPA: SRPBCC family protein [Gaiellaceae bacterium]|nr:SRPBCC family protein [Gaiellaceae bacterium]
MTSSATPGSGLLGSLHSADGAGVVRIEEPYDTDIDDLWSAITDPDRLARWHARVEGDLRPNGEFRMYLEADDIESTGRIEACDSPRSLLVTTRETDDSYRKGQGVPSFDKTIGATLTADGDQTVLVVEVRGLPLDRIAFFAAGWQIHAENLAAYIAGRGPGDVEARWGELVPRYQELAATIS